MRALKIPGKLHDLLLLRCYSSLWQSLGRDAFIVRNVSCLGPVYISQRTRKLAGNVRYVKLTGINPLLSPTVCLFAANSTETGSVTQSILKANLAQSAGSGTGEESGKADNRDKTNKSKEKEKGKSSESWFSAKHGWKLGLLSLAFCSVLLGGEAVYFWGKSLYRR